MLKTTTEALEDAESADDVPAFWPLPSEAQAATKGARDMANEQASEKVISQGWDDVDKSVGSGGAFMKWTDGQVIEVNICGVPKHVEKDWGDGKGPKTRINIEVYVSGEGCKTWDLAPATWKDLKDERAECKAPFIDAVFAVKRHGSGADTRYKFRYRRQLTAAEMDERGATADTKTVGGDDIPF